MDTPTMDYDKATTNKATNVELEVTRLGTLEVGSDEARNFGIWERHESMKTEMKETRWNGTRRLD